LRKEMPMILSYGERLDRKVELEYKPDKGDGVGVGEELGREV
jgi:hypothetical protein